MRGCLLLSALLASACVHRIECKAHGGPQWHEVKTAHFLVQSDLPEEDAKASANQMERLRAAVRWYFALPDEGADLTRVILVRDSAETREFKEAEGFAVKRVSESWLVTTPTLSTMAHELTHRLAPLTLLRLPSWVNEGIAEYLGSISLLPDRQAKVGAISNRIYAFRYERPMGLRELWSMDLSAANQDPQKVALAYSSAWAWVHFLTNKKPDRWAAFTGRLKKAEDPRAAFEAELPQASWSALESELVAYLDHSQFGTSVLQLAKTSTVQRSREMTGWEIHLLRRRLWAVSDAADPVREESAKKELAIARSLAAEPYPWPLARALAEPRGELSDVARKYPDDPDALMVQASTIESGPQQVSTLRKVLARDPNNAEALRKLAWDHAGHRQLESDFAFERARQLEPWAPEIEVTRAKLMYAQGRCSEISPALTQAVSLQAENPGGSVLSWIADTRYAFRNCTTTPVLDCGWELRQAARAPGTPDLSPVGAACSKLFTKDACAAAWREMPALRPADRPARLAAACAKDYCGSLPSPKPAACGASSSPADAVELHLAILTQELSAPVAGELFDTLVNFDTAHPSQAIAFTAETTRALAAQPYWKLGSTLTPSGAIETLAADNPAQRECVSAFSTEVPARGLYQETKLMVGGDGAVVAAEFIARSKRAPGFESCVLEALRKLRFPAPSDHGTVVFTWPLSVIAQEEPGEDQSPTNPKE